MSMIAIDDVDYLCTDVHVVKQQILRYLGKLHVRDPIGGNA